MDIQEIRALVKDDMQAIDRLIGSKLKSEVALINQLSGYIINSGGKRLRPLLVLLAARACGCAGEHYLQSAAIIEFIHTATLLHDDVVDASELRRGHETANAIWGNEASVLVGDFLYSRSFQMMVEIGSLPIMAIMADTTNAIAEGEVMQLLNCHDPDTTEARYLDVIRCKTAKLFEAAARLGAVLAGRSATEDQALAKYGLHLGNAFQLIDDVLDYSASSTEIGKNIGDDLAEGKPTLPLIYALQHGDDRQRRIIRKAIQEGGLEHLDIISQAIESTGAIDYTVRLAKQQAAYATTALEVLPNSLYKDALHGLADFAVTRKY
ncbi:MAG: polyprenyl synthetase family protein [Gammaproteobacteria bacterium]